MIAWDTDKSILKKVWSGWTFFSEREGRRNLSNSFLEPEVDVFPVFSFLSGKELISELPSLPSKSSEVCMGLRVSDI